jgi:hypothetical protein
MNCRRVEHLLSDYLEGRLAAREAVVVAQHLDHCPACRRRQESFHTLGAELRGLAELQPPAQMAARAIAAWKSETTGNRRPAIGTGRAGLFKLSPFAGRRSSPFRLAPVGAALAAGALIAAASLALVHHRQDSGTRAPSLVQRNPDSTLDPRRNRLPDGPRLPGSDNRQKGGTSPLPQPSHLVHGTPAGTRDRFAPQYVSPKLPDLPIPLVPSHLQVVSRGDDLRYLNPGPDELPRWVPMKPDEWAEIERKVRENTRVLDDFVQIPFPRIADTSGASIVAATEAYKREAAIRDARLVREVTVQFKGASLTDVCERLRTDAGIHLAAGRSVADEKVTVFCQKQPLRDVMRQLSRPFGYTWLRSGKPNDYRYELVQDLRGQLTEEELRNQDRNAALLALEKDLERYRPHLSLTPDEALARWRTASPGDKKLFEVLSGKGWGLIQMYFRLSPQELAALRAGQRLSFGDRPRGSERPLPKHVASGVLESLRFFRIIQGEKGLISTTDLSDPRGREPAAVPEARAKLFLDMPQSELGQFRLGGAAGFSIEGTAEDVIVGSSTPLAVGVSPTVLKPENAGLNKHLAGDPLLRARVSVVPGNSGQSPVVSTGSTDRSSATDHSPLTTERRVTTADVLEALHRETKLPIVADYYTRLYKPGLVSTRNQPLFDALSQLADSMHLRWSKEKASPWLRFRSTSFFNDRLKEVPNRLLNRWAAARRQHGHLTLDDVLEIAQLSDAQLDAKEMAEGAKELYGLAEWDLACYKTQRPHLRFLAQLAPVQRQEALGGAGLPFTKMSLVQQQQFITFSLSRDPNPLQSLDELTGATLRVDYSLPGSFQWGEPGRGGATEWVVPLEPGPRGRRVLRPVVRERTREAALASLRGVDPQLRRALWEAARRADPRLPAAPPDDEAQLFPTQLRLAIVYIPGGTNARDIRVLLRDNVLVHGS